MTKRKVVLTTHNNSPIPGNILLTDKQGVALYANIGLVRRTGYSVAEIIDSKPGKLWGGRMARSYYDVMWRRLRQEQSFSGIVNNQTKTGEQYQETLAVAPLVGIDGTTKFIALRPAETIDTGTFLSQWQSLFREKAITAGRVLPWLRRWFPGEALPESNGEEMFADWANIHWVTPIRDRFAARSDDRLLINAAQADPHQFQRLYEKYHETVRNYFRRHLAGQEDQVLDLTQDTFVRAFERLKDYEVRNAAYGTYLLRIAHSLLLNSYRQKPMFELAADLSLPGDQSTAHLTWIWETPELSSRERRAISAYYREGFSVREISQGLDISENAAKLLLSRARKKLRLLIGGI